MTARPERIENHMAQAVLALHWPDGEVVCLSHALLRDACPCSECRARRRAGQTIQSSASIRLTGVEPVGAYGLNLVFSDGHRRGIYPYQMLMTL